MAEEYIGLIDKAVSSIPAPVRTTYSQVNTGSPKTTVKNLLAAFNLQNAKSLVHTDNPYEGKVDQTSVRDKELYKSALGTPVVTDLTLKGGSYIDDMGREITFNDIRLVTVLVNVVQTKRIVKTEIQGRPGTVKEYIGMDDYQVQINGIITGGNGHYPIEDVRVLKELTNAPVSIAVVSTYLQNLDIFNLVIEDAAFDQEPGGYSKQNFSLSCVSDMPVELLISNA